MLCIGSFRCIVIAGLFFVYAVPAFALEMVEGIWELRVKYTISGMPSGAAENRFRQCLTADNPIPTVFLQARSCEVLERQDRYSTLRYKINCFTENGTLINEGKVRFGSLKITGTSKSDLGKTVGRNSVIRYKFTGRRIGPCN